MTVGERIKARRKELNMTQKDLATSVQVSQQMIAQIENSYRTPRQNTLNKIANALGVSVEYLIETTSEPNVADDISMHTSEQNYEKIFKVISNMISEARDTQYSPESVSVISKYNKLNSSGKTKVDEYISDLLKIEDYLLEE